VLQVRSTIKVLALRTGRGAIVMAIVGLSLVGVEGCARTKTGKTLESTKQFESVSAISKHFAETARNAEQKRERDHVAALCAYLQSRANASDRRDALTELVKAADIADAGDIGVNAAEALLAERPEDENSADTLLDLVRLARKSERLLARASADVDACSRRRGAAPMAIARARVSLAEGYAERGLFDNARSEWRQILSIPDVKMNESATRVVRDRLRALDKMGLPFEDFQAVDITEKPVSAGRFAGRVVLLEFWARWCGPCKAQIPRLVELQKEFGPKGLVILGVNLDESVSDLPTFLCEKGITWPQMPDRMANGKAISDRYGIDAIPYTLLIDRKGRLQAEDLSGDALRAAIERLL
jgi:thiol-disulfide isomerase/thioredoxin